MPQAALLSVDAIEVVYGGSVLAVADISLVVRPNEIIALLGANGAGKSTTLKAISGLVHADRAGISRGSVRFHDKDITGIAPNILAGRGIVHVLEGRHVFPHLTVEENLRVGGFLRRPGWRAAEADLEQVYGWFPRLKTKRRVQAGLTSGGEQQMLAIARALLTRPELVLLDEPSMGLAPMIVDEIFEIVGELNRSRRISFLIAEQTMNVALRHADRAYIIDSGKVSLSGTPAELRSRGNLHEFYLGAAVSA